MKKLLSTGSLIVSFLCTAQSSIDQLTSQFEEFHESFFLEKIYLQTDKESLSLGDTLWFSAYQVDGRTHVPTRHSLVMYAELVDPSDSIVERLTISFDEHGRSQGSFAFSDSLDAGKYQLRGYTNYQRNFAADFFFTQQINVVPRLSSQKTISNTRQVRPLQKNVEFDIYPEGGDFIAGLTNYFAFVVKDETGQPLNITGEIYDDRKNLVGSFSTDYEGLGKAQVNIKPGRRYACEFVYKEVPFSFPFPDIQPSGYSLSVRFSDSHIYLVADGNAKSAANPYLLLQSRGRILQISKAKAGQKAIYMSLKRAELPSGLLTVTLFDASGKPRAERVIYNENQAEKVQVSVSPAVKSISTRELMNLTFDVAEQDKGTEAYLTTTVVPASLYATPTASIQSQLWFLSDLKGMSQVPMVFFEEQNSRRMDYIDLYCLTNGWRRFDWDSIQNRETPSLAFIPEQGFTVKGRVSSYTNRNKGVQSEVYLSFLEDPTLQVYGQADAEGFFSFERLDVLDSVTAFVKTVSPKQRKKELDRIDFNTYVSLSEPSFPEVVHFSAVSAIQKTVDEAISKRGEKLFDIASAFDSEAIILEAVEIEEKKETFSDPFRREFALYRKPDSRVVLDSIKGFSQYLSIFDAIRGRVPGVQVQGVSPNQSALIRGFNSLNGNNRPLYLFDGVIVDESFINTIQPQDILYIDVLRGANSAALYGGRSAAGVIAVYSRKGDDRFGLAAEPAGLHLFKIPGYDAPRQFYVPDYAVMSTDRLARPDYRSTLYWNPKIQVTNEEAKVSFYTSDETGLFYIITEGITNDGRIIQNIENFEVF